MDLIIRLNQRDQPTVKEVAAAIKELADKVDDQYLEDLIFLNKPT